MQNHERVYRSKKEIIVNNFLGGIAWGIGSTLGLATILAILGFLAKEINLIPLVGNFVTEITKYVVAHR